MHIFCSKMKEKVAGLQSCRDRWAIFLAYGFFFCKMWGLDFSIKRRTKIDLKFKKTKRKPAILQEEIKNERKNYLCVSTRLQPSYFFLRKK